MSILPTKILLATDGSREARLAARTAVELAQKTDSELHVIHVFDVALIALLYPEATDPKGVKVPEPILEEDLQRHAREVLDGEVNPEEELLFRDLFEDEIQREVVIDRLQADCEVRTGRSAGL